MSASKAVRVPVYLLLLLGAALLSLLYFLLSYQYDNKYTWPAHPAGNGVLRLDMPLFQQRPLLFLMDDWEIYQGRLLSPEEYPEQQPDRYSRLDTLRDGADVTCRMTIFADKGEYAVELPPHLSAARIWIDGQLRQDPAQSDGSVSGQARLLPIPSADGQIEILIAAPALAAPDFASPVAFGTLDTLNMVTQVRRFLHGLLAGVALAATITCAVMCISLRFSLSHLYGALLGAVSAVLTGAGAFSAGLPPKLWWLLVCLVWLLSIALMGRLDGLNNWIWRAALVLAAAGYVWTNHTEAFPRTDYRIFSGINVIYVWIITLYLFATVTVSALQKNPHACGMLPAIITLVLANVFDLALPQYEPIAAPWRCEVAAFIMFISFTAVLSRDWVTQKRDRMIIAEKGRTADLQLQGQREKVELQQQLIESARIWAQEKSHAASLMQINLVGGHLEELEQQLVQMAEPADIEVMKVYSGHELINIILTTAFAKANLMDIKVDYTIQGIPQRLHVDERDLAGILINLLDNALEANAEVARDSRWIRLSIRYHNGMFAVECHNAMLGPVVARQGTLCTSKEDNSVRGYGLRVVQSIVDRHNGALNLSYDETSFSVYAGLQLTAEKK